jgi:hypothetical protein
MISSPHRNRRPSRHSHSNFRLPNPRPTPNHYLRHIRLMTNLNHIDLADRLVDTSFRLSD